MKSKIFLFLFSISTLLGDYYSDIGDKNFSQKNYKKAVDNYEKSKDKNKSKIRYKRIQCYINLGNNFSTIREYKTALYWYKKATILDKNIASMEISKVYEKLGNRYRKVHKYEKALQFYKKALQVRDKTLQQKIKDLTNLLEHRNNLANDTRKIVTKSSPAWTHCVGRLIIPTQLKFTSAKSYSKKRKNCSATLVNLTKEKDSQLIITAAHCLTQFNPQAGSLKFIIKGTSDEVFHRKASIEFQSNFNIKKLKTTTDFAILSLDKPISKKEVTPMILTKDPFYSLQKKSIKNFASLVGFSSDIAQYGSKLTYDPICKLKRHTKMYGASTCSGFKGASGGAIILSTTNDNKTYKHHFVGVVSHFRNKNYKNIYFAPHHLFFDKIEKISKGL